MPASNFLHQFANDYLLLRLILLSTRQCHLNERKESGLSSRMLYPSKQFQMYCLQTMSKQKEPAKFLHFVIF
ncbi:hypothetical protein CDAR_235461 [Caerostris darwini]|uniref:Uncharacterized protein n=1 Tax=Caerostris darwini TaxID=1538125 RepID=A0AAV4NAQ3_9ARAC|nr:hypothetical protein CDAR_235461 [Caerostris darwini]